MTNNLRDLPRPDLVICQFPDETITVEALGLNAMTADDPMLAAELRGPRLVALLNSDRLASTCYQAGVQEVLLLQVNPAYTGLREYLGLRAMLEPLDGELRARAEEQWRALLFRAHLLRREDYPRPAPALAVPAADRNRPLAFPVDALPTSIAKMVCEGALSQGVDPAMWGVPALGALAGAIGGSRFLRMKRTWLVPSSLWVVTVAPSGSGKSPPLHALTAPHRERDRQLIEATTKAIAEYEASREARKRTGPRSQIAHEPRPPRLAAVIDDATMEAVILRLSENPRGLIMVKDELSAMLASFDAYRHGRGADEQRWMEIYDAQLVKSDRKTDDRPTISARRPCISIVGTIQPPVLRKVMNQQRRDSGFAARMLFAVPSVSVPDWNDHDIPLAVSEDYCRCIGVLLGLKVSDPPAELTLSGDAQVLWQEFYNRVGHSIRGANNREEFHLSSAIVKLRSTALRLALGIALGLAADISPQAAEQLREVHEEAMSAAINLADWFMEQLLQIHTQWRIDPDEPESVVELVRRAGGRTTVRDLMRLTRRFRSAQEARIALDTLAAAGKGSWQKTRAQNGRKVDELVLTDDADAVDAADADASG